MNDAEEICKHLNVINEAYNQLIRMPAGSVLLPTMKSNDPYLHYRMSINLANEDDSLDNTKEGEAAMWHFSTKEDLNRAKKLFTNNGFPYEELEPLDQKEEENINTKSPVPLNPWWGKHTKK